MKRRLRSSRISGFTLVELVTVILILGILSLGTVSFIGDSSRGFASTVSRTQLGSEARYVIERLSRELRNALPGSLRVSGACLEFVPVVGASRYVTLPLAAAAASFRSAPVDPLPVPPVVRVAVQPDGSAYALSIPGAVSPAVNLSAPDASNEITVSFATPHRFVSESAARRYFLVTEPVSYCVDGDGLYRYEGYGFVAAQPGPVSLPAALPGRSLVVERVVSAAPFTLSGATLTRNSVVELDLALARDGDSVRIEHLVQVRNVP